MKVLLVGKNSKSIEGLVKKHGFSLVEDRPDVIISYGGDGTLLHGEIHYPGIPKLPIRDSLFCHKCPAHQDEALLTKLKNHELHLQEYTKLETKYQNKTLLALNDFVIRNEQPIHAIRFRIDHTFYIGDGIVVATPFGSTAYFKSVTGKSFISGFGLAFNNTTEKESPIYLNTNGDINFQLARGKATLSFDNNPDVLQISEGSELIFKLSDQVAKIYDSSLRCPNCQVIRS